MDAALRGALGNSATAMVDSALYFVEQHAKSSTEVDCVAEIVTGAVPWIAALWLPMLKTNGIQLAISGVFCHQSPMVGFPDPVGVAGGEVTCELADLLIVHDEGFIRQGGAPSTDPDFPGFHVTRRSAVLIQAKKNKSGSVRSPDPNQLHLYMAWPDFRITRGGSVGAKHDLQDPACPGGPGDSGRYGLIRIGGKRTPRGCFVVDPGRPMSAATGISLGHFMAGMVAGEPGCGRKAIPSAKDPWSSLIDELLRDSVLRSFNYGGIRVSRRRRQALFEFMTAMPSNGGGSRQPLGLGASAVGGLQINGQPIRTVAASEAFGGFQGGGGDLGRDIVVEGELPPEGVSVIHMRTARG